MDTFEIGQIVEIVQLRKAINHDNYTKKAARQLIGSKHHLHEFNVMQNVKDVGKWLVIFDWTRPNEERENIFTGDSWLLNPEDCKLASDDGSVIPIFIPKLVRKMNAGQVIFNEVLAHLGRPKSSPNPTQKEVDAYLKLTGRPKYATTWYYDPKKDETINQNLVDTIGALIDKTYEGDKTH